jgi:hypothetical protein
VQQQKTGGMVSVPAEEVGDQGVCGGESPLHALQGIQDLVAAIEESRQKHPPQPPEFTFWFSPNNNKIATFGYETRRCGCQLSLDGVLPDY